MSGDLTVIRDAEELERLQLLLAGRCVETVEDLRKLLEKQDDTIRELEDRLGEIHSWAVCAAITTPEDMLQNIGRVEEVSNLDKEKAE